MSISTKFIILIISVLAIIGGIYYYNHGGKKIMVVGKIMAVQPLRDGNEVFVMQLASDRMLIVEHTDNFSRRAGDFCGQSNRISVLYANNTDKSVIDSLVEIANLTK